MTAGLPWGATPLERAVEAMYRRSERWVAIDQLLAGVTPIPWTDSAQLERDQHAPPCDDWAEAIVQAAAFSHIQVSPGCRGYTTWSSGRAGCGSCGWGMSARTDDVGMLSTALSSARFAQAAIAQVGQSIALAVGEVVQALFEAVLPC